MEILDEKNHLDIESAKSIPNYKKNLSRVIGYMLPHKAALVLTLFLGIIYTLGELAIPLMFKQMQDNSHDNQLLSQLLIALLLILIFSAIAAYFQWAIQGKIGEKVVAKSRVELFSKVLLGRIDDVKKKSPGDLVSRIVSDTALLRESCSSHLVDIINSSIFVIGTLIAVAFLDFQLFTIALVFTCITVIYSGIFMPKMAKFAHKSQEAAGELGGFFETCLRALLVIKSRNTEKYEILESKKLAKRAGVFQLKLIKVEALTWIGSHTIMQLGVAIIIFVGASRLGDNSIQFSSLASIIVYVIQIARPISIIMLMASEFQRGVAAASRIAELDDILAENHQNELENTKKINLDNSSAIISVKDLSFKFETNEFDTLKNINFEIAKTGQTAIVGPSGSGKSTLFSLFLKFRIPTNGDIYFGDTNYHELSLSKIRDQIGYVDQETPLLPGSILDNLTHPDKAISESIIWEVLDQLQLTEKIKSTPQGLKTQATQAGFSGGQKQRLSIARALISKDPILLLDEATAQLDSVTEVAVQQALAKLSKTSAVVTIAHRLSTVVLADKIILLVDGKVDSVGTHKELLTNSTKYKNLVEAFEI